MQAWSGCLDRKLPITCPGQNVRDSVRKSALVLSLWRSDGFAESLPRPVLGWEQNNTQQPEQRSGGGVESARRLSVQSRCPHRTSQAPWHSAPQINKQCSDDTLLLPRGWLVFHVTSSLFLQINRRAQCKGSLHHADWRRGYQVQLLPVAIQ